MIHTFIYIGKRRANKNKQQNKTQKSEEVSKQRATNQEELHIDMLHHLILCFRTLYNNSTTDYRRLITRTMRPALLKVTNRISSKHTYIHSLKSFPEISKKSIKYEQLKCKWCAYKMRPCIFLSHILLSVVTQKKKPFSQQSNRTIKCRKKNFCSKTVPHVNLQWKICCMFGLCVYLLVVTNICPNTSPTRSTT